MKPTKKASVKPVATSVRHIEIVPTALGSVKILAQIETIHDDLSRWLSREAFQPQTLLKRALAEKDAAKHAALLADAQRYYLIKRIVNDCGKQLKNASLLRDTGS